MGKSKIYTRTGDEGFTSLADGKRTTKHCPRIEAYGSVDELNANISCLVVETNDKHDKNFLKEIQSELFTLGGYLASEPNKTKCAININAVTKIENELDALDEILPPVHKFILPGGCRANAEANVCRTVCRRAERAIYRLNEEEKVDDLALKYINRLSDYFFLLGRKYNASQNIDEIFWEKPC
ncbi:MAG: cob(I)yrinic acid a,c-diamide adenosyltransferase [Dysgonamonadaceae bacterium]|jgi:cob(I)alamin adenosyltransferase|nr:cob(I)yrinic acid a,c-diamide adenosyltransferase [Dysgonamonadaceae bacterium]